MMYHREKALRQMQVYRTVFFGASIYTGVYTGAAMGGPWGAAAGLGVSTMGEGVIMVKDKIVPKVRNKLKQAHSEYNRWLNWRYGRR